jgi:2-polyprenyl-6-methoxyphenol hydroxylase-like FAD-dependent oxidoreductase
MNDRSVLIVGGGIAGMSLAIRLGQANWNVDLVEIDPDWRVYGAGISITAPTYRALRRLGVVDEIDASGFGSHRGIRICTPAGQLIVEQHIEPIEPGLPTHGGIMRPVLHAILARRTRESGARVRLGVTMTDHAQQASNVCATTSDGEVRDYDLVVGADGAFSAMRQQLFPGAAAPAYTGQYCWRVVAERPREIEQCHFYVAGPVTAGVMPTSTTAMYMFLLHAEREKVRIDEVNRWQRLRGLMAPFSGTLGRVRDELGPASNIIVRPLEAILLPRPWHRGHAILIGDTVHATTPHLASGAGIAIEDALVLSEELASCADVSEALERFEERRWERCRMVVENSVRIGALEQTHADPATLKALMAESELGLRGPI